MKHRVFFIINILWVVICYLIYKSAQVSPDKFWLAGFVTFLIPFALVINFILIIIWLFLNPVLAIVPVLALTLGFRYIQGAFPLNFSKKVPEKNLSVLNYNVRVFNSYKHLRKDNSFSTSKKMIAFILEKNADIVCLQEFYNDNSSNIFNTVKKFSTIYPYHYITGGLKNMYGNQFGQAIFSKYPILDKGFVSFSNKTKNGTLFTDIKYKNKKLRIYNVHLQSMALDEKVIIDGSWNNEDDKNIFKELTKIKNGLVYRANQTKVLTAHINKSPFPVIVCGDINDTPFSYTYNKLKSLLSNSHEEAGFGWGTTYNGKLPLLRIDVQFATPKLKVVKSETCFEADYSDHFPVFSRYVLP